MSQETIFEVDGFEVYKMDGSVVFNLDESKVDLAEASLSVCRELARQQVELSSLQSLVVEYLAAKREWEVNQERFRDVCNGPHNPPLHNQVHDLVYKSFDAMEAAEQALRAAVPN